MKLKLIPFALILGLTPIVFGAGLDHTLVFSGSTDSGIQLKFRTVAYSTKSFVPDLTKDGVQLVQKIDDAVSPVEIDSMGSFNAVAKSNYRKGFLKYNLSRMRFHVALPGLAASSIDFVALENCQGLPTLSSVSPVIRVSRKDNYTRLVNVLVDGSEQRLDDICIPIRGDGETHVELKFERAD